MEILEILKSCKLTLKNNQEIYFSWVNAQAWKFHSSYFENHFFAINFQMTKKHLLLVIVKLKLHKHSEIKFPFEFISIVTHPT